MTRRFHSASAPRLSREEALRQSRITNLALAKFVVPAEVIAFLNEPDDVLGGSPLQIAVGSSEGLLAVKQRIAVR